MTDDTLRLALAALLAAAYVGLCVGMWWRHRRRPLPAAAAAADWVVAYASQTGSAEYLARNSAALLETAGLSVRLCEIADLDLAALAGTERILFVASTFGEGDPPDSAAPFLRHMAGPASLAAVHYAVLALGDRSYTHYCGFGRALDDWLAGGGAHRLFDRVEVDRNDAAAIAHWQEHLCHLSGASEPGAWEEAPYSPWRIVARSELNPGSAGAPVYRVRLQPAAGALPSWQSGDLVQLATPEEPALPREYSIASIGQEEAIELLVRLHARPDGSIGLGSGWLCRRAAVGDTVQLRLREHRRFRLDNNAARPLVLIGNGTGMAGLRSHLAARVAAGESRNWLVFGERNAATDFHFRADVQAWFEGGGLARCDAVFSRDQAGKRYVQHALQEAQAELRAWVDDGAAIYVCGSLQTMAADVHRTLAAILGAEVLDGLAAAGRYRRDVY
jgi:sulfite reductase (NADPH) flavoprotein alpha-component